MTSTPTPTTDTATGDATGDVEVRPDLGREDQLLGVPLRAFLRPSTLRGLLLVSAAAALIVWPDRTDRALGLVLGVAIALSALLAAIDLVRHREHRTFWSLLLLSVAAGLGTGLISQPVESLVSTAQAAGLVLAAAALREVLRTVRARRITAWTATKTIGLGIGAALLLAYPETLLLAAAAVAAGVAAAIGLIQLFADERDLAAARRAAATAGESPAGDHLTGEAPADDAPAGQDGATDDPTAATDGAAEPDRSLAANLVRGEVAQVVISWIRRRSEGAEDREELHEKLFFEGPESPVRYARFIALMAFASIIASVGIIVESTAVVIGAMLIAPLMVPLMGTAFATAMAWPRRMARCASIAASGIVLAITTGAVVGAALPRTIDPTSNTEVLSRISPTSVDLVIAVAAGAAGAYAMARRDISDSLPGVAVAIALVPPLTVVGLCWQQQAWAAGNGALLLFLTNAVAILLAGGITFVLVGAAPIRSAAEGQERVSTAIVALLSLTAVVMVLLALNGTQLARTDLARAEIDEVLTTYQEDHPAHEVIGRRTKADGTMVISLAGPGRPPSLGQLLSDLHAANRRTAIEVNWVDQQRATIQAN